MAKLPAFQFYTGDWLKDPAVRSVSTAARGLWIDMLCLMHESDRRGYLQHATGKPVTAEQLARMTGCSTDDVSRLLQELRDSGVFSCTDHGSMFNRRMVRDERKRQLCADAGKRGGGNPTFKGLPKGIPKGGSKHPSVVEDDIEEPPEGGTGETESQRVARAESEARSFAVGWITAECPKWLKSKNTMQSLVLRLGKTETVRLVREAMANPNVGNAIEWINGKLEKQEMAAQLKAEKNGAGRSSRKAISHGRT